jgi:hypothetical protein
MATPKTTTASAISFDADTVVQLATAIKQLEKAEAAAAPQRPQILVRVSRRVITEKELEAVSAVDKQNGVIAKISHSELAQNRLITTVVDNSETEIQGVPFAKGKLADYRCVLHLEDASAKNPIVRVLADLDDMPFHAMKDGQPVEGGGIAFAVTVEADSFDLRRALNDSKLQVVPIGNIKISPPHALPDAVEIDLKSELEAAETERLAQKADAAQRRELTRRKRLDTTTDAIVNSVLQDAAANIPSMEELATADS